MSSQSRFPTIFLATTLALALAGGCATTRKADSKKEPAGTILSSGPSSKVTSQQSADVQIAMGRTLEEEGKHDEARTAYLSALKLDPKRSDAEDRLAILEDRKANAKDADKHFAQALKLDPKNPDILCDRGYSLSQRKNLFEAEKVLRQALEINPLHQRSHNNLALVLARKGDSQAALEEFAKAGCDNSDAQANLALVLAMEGKYEESKKSYVKALAAKPTSTTAKRGLEATIAALAGEGDSRAIATRIARPENPADASVVRTSAQPGMN